MTEIKMKRKEIGDKNAKKKRNWKKNVMVDEKWDTFENQDCAIFLVEL